MACRQALQGQSAPELIINASVGFHQLIPDTTVFIQQALGLRGVAGFSLRGTCLSFLYALQLADAQIRTGQYRRVLITSAELNSRVRNFAHPESAALLGDAGAAILLEGCDSPELGMEAASMRTWPQHADLTEVQGFGLRHHPLAPDTREHHYLFAMDGPMVLRAASRLFVAHLRDFIAHTGVSPAEVDLVVPHQASGTALRFLARCGFAEDKTVNILADYGNSHLYQGLGSGRLQFRYFDMLQPRSTLLQQIARYQPTVLIAPPCALRMLAEAVKRGDLEVDGPGGGRGPHLVSVAEVLEPDDRALIERLWGSTVHIAYVATEGFVASTCGHGSLHLNEDLLLVEKEWLDRERSLFVPIVTDLHRRVVPILRYRLDDVLSLCDEPCPCGSPHLRLSAVHGRCDDVFNIGGQMIAPDFLRRAALHASEHILSYSLVQTDARAIRAELVVSTAGLAEGGQIGEALGRRLQECLRAVGAGEARIDVQMSAATPALDGRKVRRIRREWKARPNNDR